MANPSLQIGNSNWAIKEDNLLGYSTAGTRFVPQPITMTRASAGTRVNSSGLVETVELLGSELVVNGDFSSDTDWIKAPSGVTISGGSANFNSASDTYVYQDILTTTKTYKIIFSGTINSGSLYIGENGVATNTYTAGTYTNEVAYFTVASSSRFIIRKTGVGTLDATIDNISVKESTKNNLARVDYTDSTSSLLAEPQRTNVFIQNDISTWNGFSSYADETTAPDGTTIDFVNMEDRRIFPTTTISNSTEYTSSIYLKGNKTADVKLRNTAANDTVITLSTEWQRFELTATSVSTITNALLIDARFSQGMDAAGLEIAIYGGQVEEGSYATSYIPTDGSTVTRVQDQYSKTGISNLINSTEGVLFVEIAALSNDETFRLISLSDGTNTNEIIMGYRTGSNAFYVNVTSGTGQVFEVVTLSDVTTLNKIAFKYKENDFALWVNGVEVATDLSGLTPSNLSVLNFSRGDASSLPFFGKVKQLQVFKTALTDTELATLTT